jgi:arylsulfatase A-like enzyme
MKIFAERIISTMFCTVPLVYAYSQERPNIILILADDMGYSDIGCYGGEILTPNIDNLALHGVRMTQFYNTSRSCPTRASLMTGLYQHQTGIGWMSEDPCEDQNNDPKDWGIPQYRGSLNKNCVTIAEVLKSSGYHTYMTGKWHLGLHGSEKWPLQRGFERFYGILAGACSYLRPDGDRGLTLDNTKLPAPETPYYTTDAFTDYAIKFIKEQNDNKPFFLYLAYNAPHWPLQAKDEDIAKFYKMYREKGWDVIRQERHDRMMKLGIIGNIGFAEWENRTWKELTEKEKDNTAFRMAVYAAQVYSMDYNIGKLLEYLKKINKYDNTLIIFMSDNGACAEPHNELGGGRQVDINNPAVSGHPSYGKAWAQVSNTPFRKYKQRAYEGGIATPFIMSWKKGLSEFQNVWRKTPTYLPDVMPTLIKIAEAKYPCTYMGNRINQLVGVDMMPIIRKGKDYIHDYMYWEHQGNRAVRWKDWKAVWDQDNKTWELYNINDDRVESKDLANKYPEILKQLSEKWNIWAVKYNVMVPFVIMK